MKTDACWRLARLGIALLAVSLTALALGRPLAEAESVSATYSCTAETLGQTRTYTSPIIISGATPSTVAPGASVKVTGFQAKLTIPASQVAELESFGVTWIDGQINTWDINATDAQTATRNAAGRGITIPKTTLPKPAAVVTIKVPATPKTVGTWKAKAAGTMDFNTGSLKFTEDDNLGVSIPVACRPQPVSTISRTAVS